MPPQDASARPASPDFLTGGGEAGAFIRGRDWPSHPLGPPEAWPQPLKTAVSLMLATGHPMCLAWGPDLAFLYNDAYAPILTTRHPRALGRPIAEVWADIWPDIAPLVDRTLAGDAIWQEDMHLVMSRDGRDEDTWWTFSYSPLRDEDGAVRGFVNICNDMTGKVLNERRLTRERDGEARFRALVNASSDVVYRMSPDWTEMRRLDGRGFLADTGEPSIGWLDQYVFAEDRPRVVAAIAEAVRNRSVFELEHRVRRMDGAVGWAFSRAVPVLDADGEIAEWFGMASDVTERVNAQTALRESEARYRTLFGTIDEGFCVIEFIDGPHGPLSDYVHIDANPAYLANAGIPDIVGKRLREIVDDEADAWAETYRRVLVTGEPVRFERLLVATGRHLELAAFRVEPSENRQVAVLFKDVTERKRAEERLSESEARFKTVAETMPGFVWTADENGVLDYASPNWRAYSGADPNVSNGKGWESFVHPDDQASAFGRWAQAIATATPYEVEFRLRRADGTYRWWLARARPSVQAGQTAPRWIGVCTDLDDIIAAREVLSRSREELMQTVDARTAERDRIWRLIPDLLMTGSLDGWLLSVNPAWRESLGYDEATLFARPFWELIHPESLADSAEAVRQMKDGQTARHQNRVRTAAGAYRWFDWVSTPVGDLFYAVARDITDDKQREAELLEAQEALRQSQKMEAVGQLTGGIAHDFNNMLAIVTGSLDLLRRRMQDPDPRALRYVDAAMEGARRAALLTQRLLAFSRQQPLKPEPVDVNRLVANMSDLLRHSLGADVRLETVLAGGLWRTSVDPNQLENVILNLGVNARDAMPEGGRLTIDTQNGHLDARYAAAHPGVPEGQYVVIAVSDTGTGMAPDVIAKAFDPFFTTKPVGKGTGLGLSQVYGFVKQSGGHVKIYSEPGHGTTIKIYLPRIAGGAADVAGEDALGAVPLADRDEVVLVVEDEPAVRAMSVEALNELGYRVLEADGAAAALRLIDAHPEIALLFTDIVMPDVNGAKLAAEARLRRPGLKVLFTTGYTRNAIVHNGVLDPGVELVGKPFTIEELAAKLRKVLDQSPE